MDIDASRLSATLSHLYAAATDPDERRGLADNLARAFDATSCLMHTRESGPGSVTILGATDNVSALLPSYTAYYYARDVWSERSIHVAGRSRIGEEFVPERELTNSEWYYDLCRPYDIHHLVGAVFDVEADVRGLIGIHRPRDATGFKTRDKSLMTLLLPHLRQAIRLLRIVDEHQRAQSLTFDVLAALSIGVFVVSSGCRVRFMNAAAERVARACSPVSLRNERISICDPKLADRFHNAVAKACLAGIGRSVFAGDDIAGRTRDGEPFVLLIVPIPPSVKSGGPEEPLAAILISDHQSRPEMPHQILKAVYGLTTSETRVLAALLKGQTLPEIAKDAGLSINTIHSQARAVFAKTGVHRQSDLVGKVLDNPLLRAIPAILRRDGHSQ